MTSLERATWVASTACLVALGSGCGDDDDPAPTPTRDAAADAADAVTKKDAAASPMKDAGAPGDCPAPAPNQPYEALSCTGLFSDIEAKTLAQDVREFAPAVPLWSDGAEKTRFVYLPPGEKIDIKDPDAWRFPVGTKLWKEFKWEGKRVETRLFWKLSATFWARTAYKWNEGETEATRSGGEEVKLGAASYFIPSTTECDQCHKGRIDRVLGFEALSLGLPGATGLTLAKLNEQGLLTGGALPDVLTLGDDGSGRGAEALSWLHVNCGVSCHNGSSTSEAYSTNLRMKLLVADADGSDTSDVDTWKTGVGVDAVIGRWLGTVRVVPGDPDHSLLYMLMSTRNPAMMKQQMPPIASRVVPTDAAVLISDWITHLNGSQDAGVP